MLFHTNFTLMIHTVAISLTLSLAIWRLVMVQSNISMKISISRFIMIKFPSKAVTLCTVPRCKMVLAFGYGECLIFWIGNNDEEIGCVESMTMCGSKTISGISVCQTVSQARSHFAKSKMVLFVLNFFSVATSFTFKMLSGASLILTIPNTLFIKMSTSMKITEDGDGDECYTLHHLEINDWGNLKSGLHFSLTLWLYSIILKLVPCLVLTIFTACLVRAMYQVIR